MKKAKVIIITASILVILLAGTSYLLFTGNLSKDKKKDFQEPVTMEKKIECLYGIPVDSFRVVKGIIENNQIFGNILNSYGVAAQKIYQVEMLPREQFDVRKIRTGNHYALFLDSLGLKYAVYEKDPVNYAVIHLEDSVHLELGKKEVRDVTNKKMGKITSSLWNAMIDSNAPTMIALELSEIYAWSIDFFGLQEGDEFKVIYDESFVDSVSMGVTKIHAAWFLHAGKEFWAIPFIQDSVRSFYDEKGNSLRKTFLKAPLQFSRISSRFSNSRMHPILKIRRPHHGVDYAAPAGTPVHAVGDGQVIAATYQGGGGNYVKIKHNGTYTTAYLHLSRFGKGIKSGAWVKQGDIIGYVGSTGLSTGSHLDFRFYKNGNAVDPLKVEAPPVEPIHEENLVDFELVKLSWMAALQ